MIAIISLLIIGGGMVLSLTGSKAEAEKELPVVEEFPELIDANVKKEKKEKTVRKKTKVTVNKRTENQRRGKIRTKESGVEEQSVLDVDSETRKETGSKGERASTKKTKPKSPKNSKKVSKSKAKPKEEYRRRSPLDEPV